MTCHRDFDDERNIFQSCWLYASWKTKAHESSLFELKHDRFSVDIEQKSKEIKAYDQIHSDNIHLQYNGEGDSSLKFNLVNKTNNQLEQIVVSLRYWDSHNDQGGEQNSGAYIFRTKDGDFSPNIYSKFKHGVITTHKLGSQMTFYFED